MMANTMRNEELAVGVVETFLPNSVETLESLAGQSAINANVYRRLGEWEAARRYDAIAARFREVIAGERLLDY